MSFDSDSTHLTRRSSRVVLSVYLNCIVITYELAGGLTAFNIKTRHNDQVLDLFIFLFTTPFYLVLSNRLSMCLYGCACVRTRARVCVCVCVRVCLNLVFKEEK